MVSRFQSLAGWAAAAFMLPYLVLKIVWVAGVPVGVNDPDLMTQPVMVVGNALTGGMELVGLALVLAFTRPWGRRLPAWLVLPPIWIGTGLLFPVVAVTVLGAVLLMASGTSTSSAADGPIQPWIYLMVYVGFAGQGATLVVAFVLYVRTRWGGLLGGGTPQASPPAAAGSRWAVAVAAVAGLLAATNAYWAFGGTIGLSPRLDRGSELSLRLINGVMAVVAVAAAWSLLTLVRRSRAPGRLWLPVSLTWLGTGAMCAFGVWLMLGPLVASALGQGTPGQPIVDLANLLRVLVGLVAAVSGALALRARARLSPALGLDVPG